MKQLMLLLVFAISLPAALQAQGAAYAGRGHTGVADASDAFASYWNPAALAFLAKKEIVYERARWLPNLADDMVYNYIGGRVHIPNLGTLGGHIIYLNLGNQERTDEMGNRLETFHSYTWTITASFGVKILNRSSVGFNLERIYRHLSEFGTGNEESNNGKSSFVFDVGYFRQMILSNLDMGLAIHNMGTETTSSTRCVDADPLPVKFALGFKYNLIERERTGVAIYYDLNKLLVASHPSVDLDGDGIIGGYDEDGNSLIGGEYSRDGEQETAHTDPWYRGLITSWYDDWLYGGDIDRNGDGIINADEVGNRDEGSLKAELRTLTPHVGIEWRFLTHYTVRAGMIHDRVGKLREYSLGTGIHFRSFRIDLAYIPVQEISVGTRMKISLNLAF